ncbi:MAG: AGE family epimerase/isomerase [Candidatus Cryptobacteroides sp.]|nr:AGE family epimerase/isomerase [Bacteroides sp.]MDY5408319.1 AGE family epimerase/isomerase [Candidatus Cryptobacteroides sp.]
MDFKKLSDRYRNELLDNVLPFWLENSQDREYGGYFSCLNRDGSVYDTDKFVWLQGREVWMFAMLYNNVEKNRQWLDCAVQGAEFLKKYGHDENWDFYFSLDRKGNPLVQPYNIFSNTFACMAFAQLAKATGNEEYAQIARRIFGRILERRSNPKGQWCKAYPGTRPMKDFALPMIICNMALEIEDILEDKSVLEQTIDTCLHEVFDVFYKPELGCMLENVSSVDGAPVDCFEGREINPGHDLEALWFMMNLGVRRDDKALIEKCVEISLNVIERGWDKEFGGIYYFLDAKGVPQQKLEWDQKLWWVHIESAIAMLKGYQLTGNEKCLEWFLKLDAYLWDNFKDKEYPEWFGYLNRRGEVLLPLKGGKWKGCFHVPRGLFQCWKTLEALSQQASPEQ